MVILPNGPGFMSETPVPCDPGRDDIPLGVPAGPGDRPTLGSPGWRLVPHGPDWPEWMGEDAHAEDEDPGDLDEYQDPDYDGWGDLAAGATIAGSREHSRVRASAPSVQIRSWTYRDRS